MGFQEVDNHSHTGKSDYKEFHTDGDDSGTDEKHDPQDRIVARFLTIHRALRLSAISESRVNYATVLGEHAPADESIQPLLKNILVRTSTDVHDTALSSRQAYQELHALLANSSKPLLYGPEGGGKLTAVFSVCRRVGMFPWVFHTVDLLDPIGRQALTWVVNNDKRAVIVIRDAHNLTDESLAVLGLGLSGRNPPCVGLASSPSKKGCRARGFFGSTHHWPALQRDESEAAVTSLLSAHAFNTRRALGAAGVTLCELVRVATRDLTIGAVRAALNVAMQTTGEQLALGVALREKGGRRVFYDLQTLRQSTDSAPPDPLAVVSHARPRSTIVSAMLVAWFTRLLVSPVDATNFACYK